MANQETERCFLLALDAVKKSMIPWPQSIDSQLWNKRLDALVDRLITDFGMERHD